MTEHRIVVGCPDMSCAGWLWERGDWQRVEKLVSRRSPEGERQTPQLVPDDSEPWPHKPPLTVQLDRLSEEGWQVICPINVARTDWQGYPQVAVLVARAMTFEGALL